MIGKFVQFDTTNDHFQTGEVTAKLADLVYLFKADNRLDDDASPQFSTILDLRNDVPENMFIFDTRAEMTNWMAWLELPSSSEVVHLKTVEKTK